MKIRTLSCGDELHKYKKSLVLYFRGKRRVVSTGLNHGGCREDLQAVFNNDGNPGPGMEFRMRAPTYREHLDIIAAEDLGLDPEKCTGFCTAASMDNAAIQTMEQEYFTVTAIVTGGIEGNGARIGDPASYTEIPENRQIPETEEKMRTPEAIQTDAVRPGTINIILHIDADLPHGTLTKAMVSCAEAKAAAVQELAASSRYSRGLATGSGTDGIIVVCNPESGNTLTDAGHHSLLGEAIGRTVKKAVKEALERQTGLNPQKQHDIIRRMDRFGVTSDTLWALYRSDLKFRDVPSDRQPEKMSASDGHMAGLSADLPRYEFENLLDRLKNDDMLVTYTSLYAHLLDQLDWGLLGPEEAWKAGEKILELAGLAEADAVFKSAEKSMKNTDAAEKDGSPVQKDSDPDPVKRMVRCYMERLITCVIKQDETGGW